jgi:hypothetical protein
MCLEARGGLLLGQPDLGGPGRLLTWGIGQGRLCSRDIEEAPETGAARGFF